MLLHKFIMVKTYVYDMDSEKEFMYNCLAGPSAFLFCILRIHVTFCLLNGTVSQRIGASNSR